jgi:TPR repeat protein
MFRIASDAGNPEAQYALATLYKEGRGVPQDVPEAAKLLAAASLADNVDAEVEFGIMLYNGTGVQKDEARAAKVLMKAARRGSPIAQNRLARILATGRGMPANPVEAAKWHIVSKAGGATDLWLDTFVEEQSADVKAKAEKAAKPWLDAIAATRS